MPKPLTLAVAALALLTPALASATANYVYHEQTTNLVGTSCGTYATNLTPAPAAAYPLEFKIEYQFYTDSAVVYYTTDGSVPGGSMGVASGTTSVLAATYACTFLDPLGSGLNDDAVSATLPSQPAGTTVNYIVGAWHSGGGSEIFANSGTCGTCTACTTSSCATVFSYTVTTPVDAGTDAGPSDAGTDALPESGFDGGADGGLDAGIDAPIEATAFDGAGTDGSAFDAPLVDSGGPSPDATVDSGGRGKDAQGDTGSLPEAGFPFDVIDSDGGSSGSSGSGCGCSTPGDAASSAWGPFAMLAVLFGAAALRGRGRRA